MKQLQRALDWGKRRKQTEKETNRYKTQRERERQGTTNETANKNAKLKLKNSLTNRRACAWEEESGCYDEGGAVEFGSA